MPEEGQGGWRRWIHFQWIRTPLGLLKLGELVLVLLGLITMSTVGSVFGSGVSSLEFFMFINTTIFVIVLIVIILLILDVYKRLPALLRSNIVMLVSCGIASLMLLISSAVAMNKFKNHDTILAAGSFGLMAMFLFFFETIFYFIKFRRDGATPKETPSDTGMSEPIPEY